MSGSTQHELGFAVAGPTCGLVALCAVGVRLGGDRGQPIAAEGITLPDALRRLARRVEEAQALGPLEREPRRAAIEALFCARKEIWRLALAGRGLDEPAGASLDAIDRARERLEADVALDAEAELEDPEGGRAR